MSADEEKRVFYRLKEDVIDRDYCIVCGACFGFCNRIGFNEEKQRPELIRECVIGCNNCYTNCPAVTNFNSKNLFGGEKIDSILGCYKEIKSVRSTNEKILANSQDGGAVTSILAAALKKGRIDAAIVVMRDEKWKPYPVIVKTEEELIKAAKSKYSPSPNLSLLGNANRMLDKNNVAEISDIAIVDVSCHLRGLRNLDFNLLYGLGFSPYSDLKLYAIGLFCTGAYDYPKLLKSIKNIEEIRKIDIKRSKCIVVRCDREEALELEKLKKNFLALCKYCGDFTAELSDLSIGANGSEVGWNTVITRTPEGWAMLKDAINLGYLEAKDEVNLEELKKTARNKKRKAEKELEKAKKNGIFYPLYLEK